MRVVLDTSCMVSFFLFDTHHEKAKLVLEKLMKNEIEGMVSVLSLAEFAGVMRRNTDENIARQTHKKIVELIDKQLIKAVPIKTSDGYSSSELAISTGLKGADAIIVYAAKSNKARLLTFDEEIKKKAKDLIEFFEE